MTLQTFIVKVCERLKNPDCDNPLVTDTATYAGRIMELFKLSLAKVVNELSQKDIFQIYGMVFETNVTLSGDLDLTNINGDKASRVILIKPTTEDSLNSYKYFIEKTELANKDATIKDFIPENEVWYYKHNNKISFIASGTVNQKVDVIYVKAIDYDTTFTKTTELNDYITETLQWQLIDIVAEERLKEEARL